MKQFERHVKRDVAVVNVRRFVLLVDNWTQTGARPPMIDHATQTGFPALLDAETQTGEYTVQDVEVHAVRVLLQNQLQEEKKYFKLSTLFGVVSVLKLILLF